MKWITQYDYTGFYIARCWADSSWYFSQSAETQTVKATYYRGVLTVTDAFDKSLIGQQYTGFIDFTKHPEWNKLDEYQVVKMDGLCEWFCLHCDDGELETEFVRLDGEYTVPAGWSVVVLDGSIVTSEQVTAGAMNHIKPREQPYSIKGSAILYVIRKC